MTPAPRARFVASGFGAGHAPFAPGTAASAAAAALASLLLSWSPWAVVAACAAAAAAGFWAIRACDVVGDPGWVTIDEFAGQFAAVCGLAHPTAAGLAAAFILFRLLDISKPGPVGWADRRPGAAGIMGDDLIAGLIAAAVLLAIRRLWPGALG